MSHELKDRKKTQLLQKLVREFYDRAMKNSDILMSRFSIASTASSRLTLRKSAMQIIR